MRKEIIDGIQDRADAFVAKCIESNGGSMDAYICLSPLPIANSHVLESSRKLDVGEQTLLYKLQHSKDTFQPIQIAAECSKKTSHLV